MKKDFQKWHKTKSYIEESNTRLFFKEREVWSVSIGLNIGFEMDGKSEKFLRPIVIIKKFNNESFWGLPLSRSDKKGKYYFSFSFRDGEKSTANLSQLRLIDSKRLQYKMGVAKREDFKEIKQKLKLLMT